jgi:hypothetical protein
MQPERQLRVVVNPETIPWPRRKKQPELAINPPSKPSCFELFSGVGKCKKQMGKGF